MKPTKTSKAWMQEHLNDPYVKLAQKEGYRARAAYKLLEIDDKDKLIKPGMTIVDLGSTPGSWSQVAVQRLKGQGRVIALDILDMHPIAGVEFIQGDFREASVLRQLEAALNKSQVDLVIADMAPNITGIKDVDQAGAAYLTELALAFSKDWLKPNGNFLVKVFGRRRPATHRPRGGRHAPGRTGSACRGTAGPGRACARRARARGPANARRRPSPRVRAGRAARLRRSGPASTPCTRPRRDRRRARVRPRRRPARARRAPGATSCASP